MPRRRKLLILSGAIGVVVIGAVFWRSGGTSTVLVHWVGWKGSRFVLKRTSGWIRLRHKRSHSVLLPPDRSRNVHQSRRAAR